MLQHEGAVSVSVEGLGELEGRGKAHSQWVGTERGILRPVSPSPRCHRACDFRRTRRPPERIYGSECSIDIGKDSQALASDGVTTHPPLKLWPFPMYVAFPRSEYYGHADSRYIHPGIWGELPRPYFRSRLHHVAGLPCSHR